MSKAFTGSDPLDKKSSKKLSFSDAQCKKLIQLIQTRIQKISPWPNSTGTSHLVGNVTTPIHLASPITLPSSINVHHWILDSSATDHITPFVQLLEQPRLVQSVIHLRNGNSSALTHIGDITLHSNLILDNVFYVPTFHYNLLSIPKITNDSHCSVLFSSSSCLLQDPTLKEGMEIGRLNAGLFNY